MLDGALGAVVSTSVVLDGDVVLDADKPAVLVAVT
jgi:hypothetical protein